MNRGQRSARHARRVQHVVEANRRRNEAIEKADHEARFMSQDGRKPLKSERTDTLLVEKLMRASMERQGYVPNGRGSWRRLHQTKQPKRDPLDKA